MNYETPKMVTYKDIPRTDQQRLQWWIRHYSFTMAVVLSMGIVPVLALYRGITWFPRFYIFFYLTLYYFTYLTRRKVEEVHGKQATQKRWWTVPLRILFTLLKLWLLYIIIIVFLYR